MAVLSPSASFADRHIRDMTEGIEEDVKKLTNNFIFVKAVLSHAENRQLPVEPERVWVERLRDVSYEIEDALDVWNTVLLKKQISGAENRGGSNSYRLSDCSWLKQLAQEGDFPSRIRELNERLDDINKEKDAYKFNYEPVPAALPLPRPRKSTAFFNASTVCGRDLEIQSLVGNLCNSSQRKCGLEVISVVGMGGVGKTTLAQCVYNNASVKSHFQKRIWVCVSDPFNEEQVAKSIAKSLGGNPSDFTDLQNILECVNFSIAEKRYLLVLDDVWTEDSRNWESLLNSLDSGAGGSKIVVTTRNMKVARVMKSCFTLDLVKLSEDESWKLFSKIAFFDKNEEDVEKLEEFGKSIAKKCKGLPLALKTLASHLQLSVDSEWRKVLHSDLWTLEAAEEGIFVPLLFSYYELPLEIQKCFSYCAIFPKDHRIKVEELVRLWMSQDYLKSSTSEDMETTGKNYFQHLLTRSFFQDLEYHYDKHTGAVTHCKMHDIVHEFAQFLSKDEYLIIGMENKKSGVSSSTCRKLRHLTVLNEVNSGVDVMSSSFSSSIQQRLHDLHSLRISRSSTMREIGTSFLNLSQHLCFIKALDLRDNGIVEVPEGIGRFVHLRYLDLSENSKLKRLPRTIYELCNLQTLLLYWCKALKELPEGIEKLINLRHLEIDEETVLPIGDLRNLNNLQGFLKLNGLKNVKNGSEAKKAELSNKRGLTHLILDFHFIWGIPGHENEVIEALEPCHSLEILEILFYSGKLLPSWISSLSKLRKLRLQNCEICEELPPLGQLPSLKSLRITYMRSCKRIGKEFLGIRRGQTSTEGGRDEKMIMMSSVVVAFPKLKELEFQFMTEWTEWEDVFNYGENYYYEDGLNFTLFPCLKQLEIENCPKLRSLSQFISKSPIQTLDIWRCPILEERCRPHTGEDWSKISHIPNIRVYKLGSTVFEIQDGQLV